MSDAGLPKNLAANPLLNRWIGFEHDGFLRLSPGKVEIGQGILTALAQIAADELDVALHCVRVMPADTQSSPNEEVTSGSLSVQDSGLAVRHVAAQLRSLMIDAAATLLDVAPDRLSVENGLIHGPDNLAVSYWDLAPDLPKDIAAHASSMAKPSAARRLAGSSVPRLDIEGRVFGTRPYIHDIHLPDMRHGRVVRSAQPGALLVSCDEAAFRKAFPDVLLVRNGSFLGVVGPSEHATVQAAARLAGLSVWSETIALPERETLPDWLKTQPCHTSVVARHGNIGQSGLRRVSCSYAKPFIAHASIGPATAIAQWKGDKLEVISHTQGVFNLQKDLALVFAKPPENVRVIHAEGSGCYGHNGADDVALDAALLAQAAGCAVRVQWSRADELTQAPFGAAMRVELSAGLDHAGRIVDWEHVLYSNGHVARPGRNLTPALLAAYSLDPPAPRLEAGDPSLVAGGGAQRNAVPAYDIPNLTVLQNRVLASPLRTSSLRSLGAYGNVFAIESFMDELALEAAMDPLSFRLAHLTDARARNVLNSVSEMAAFGKTDLPEGMGKGIAFARYKNTGGYCAVVAEVDLNHEPRVTALWIAADLGEVINPDGAINQIEGGAIQSVSWTLKEAVRFSPAGLDCASWETYPILRFSEVPAVSVKLMARPDDPPLGAGECAQGPTAAAIANAVHAALGVRIRQTPITRESILRELEAT